MVESEVVQNIPVVRVRSEDQIIPIVRSNVQSIHFSGEIAEASAARIRRHRRSWAGVEMVVHDLYFLAQARRFFGMLHHHVSPFHVEGLDDALGFLCSVEEDLSVAGEIIALKVEIGDLLLQHGDLMGIALFFGLEVLGVLLLALPGLKSARSSQCLQEV